MIMPGMSGIEVLRQARQIRPDLSIIVLTANPTVDSAIAAVKAALEKRHHVLCLQADENVRIELAKNRPEFVFNLAEGKSGIHRESEVPSVLESLQIPYTGSGPDTLSLCLDKFKTHERLRSSGIPVPRCALIDIAQDCAWNIFPAIVKPNWEGSSKGIMNSSVVTNRDELLNEIRRIWSNYNQGAIVEEFLQGREFTAALLGNGENLEVLPIVEIMLDCLPPQAHRIFSYEAKWVWDKPENPLPILGCPAAVDAPLGRTLRDVAKKTFQVLECRDWGRIDLRTDLEGNVHVLEVNPLPGILPDPRENSCLPMAARTANIAYDELILSVLDIACQRVHAHRRALLSGTRSA